MIPDLPERVEEIGVFYEQTGLTPTEARVFALLLLSDPPELDFFAIQDQLNVSKGAVSNALRRLLAEGRVTYLTKPGNRRRYFRVSGEKWLRKIQARLVNTLTLGDMLDRVIQLRKHSRATAFDAELRQVQQYFHFLEKRLPLLAAEWEAVAPLIRCTDKPQQLSRIDQPQPPRQAKAC